MATPPILPSPRLHETASPSLWVQRFSSLISPGGRVLDVACGGGRHARFLHSRGHPVTAIDIDLSRVQDLETHPHIECIEYDLEGRSWPLEGRRFAAVIVTNYLWRPLFPHLVDAVDASGVLIYETFARGNARFGRPANPDHLLAPGELLEVVRGRLQIVAYEHGIVETPRPAAIERICAVKAPADPDGLASLPP